MPATHRTHGCAPPATALPQVHAHYHHTFYYHARLHTRGEGNSGATCATTYCHLPAFCACPACTQHPIPACRARAAWDFPYGAHGTWRALPPRPTPPRHAHARTHAHTKPAPACLLTSHLPAFSPVTRCSSRGAAYVLGATSQQHITWRRAQQASTQERSVV